MHLVIKDFLDGGIQRSAGELVDGNNYRMRDKLISHRYMKEIEIAEEDAVAFKCELCETDRFFIDQKTLDDHYIAYHPDQIEAEADVDTDADVETDIDEDKDIDET